MLDHLHDNGYAGWRPASRATMLPWKHSELALERPNQILYMHTDQSHDVGMR